MEGPEAHALERKCSIIETLEHDHLPMTVIAVSIRANRERDIQRDIFFPAAIKDNS